MPRGECVRLRGMASLVEPVEVAWRCQHGATAPAACPIALIHNELVSRAAALSVAAALHAQ